MFPKPSGGPQQAGGFLPTGGLPQGGQGGSDLDNARAIAKRIFDTYDRDRSGVIEPYEIGPMMSDAYKTINKAFSPSKADIDSYIRVLDRNGDGKVTLSDVEQIVIRFLLGEDYARYSPGPAPQTMGGH